MAILRIEDSLAAVSTDSQEELSGKNLLRDRTVPVSEKYISQVAKQIEGGVTKSLYREFSRTKSRNIAPLSKLDEFLVTSQMRVESGTISGISRKSDWRS